MTELVISFRNSVTDVWNYLLTNQMGDIKIEESVVLERIRKYNRDEEDLKRALKDCSTLPNYKLILSNIIEDLDRGIRWPFNEKILVAKDKFETMLIQDPNEVRQIAKHGQLIYNPAWWFRAAMPRFSSQLEPLTWMQILAGWRKHVIDFQNELKSELSSGVKRQVNKAATIDTQSPFNTDLTPLLDKAEQKAINRVLLWKEGSDKIGCASFCEILFEKGWLGKDKSTRIKTCCYFAIQRYQVDIKNSLTKSKEEDRKKHKLQLRKYFNS